VSVLVTGAAGFIGSHVAHALLDEGEEVIGLDNLNDYYDVRLKQTRLDRLEARRGFHFARLDVSDQDGVMDLLTRHPDVDRIVHLAAQAGVRYSMIDPYAYVTSNVMGHLVILEAARRLRRLSHLVYASSSSVYGANTDLPFAETDRVDTPLSTYAATKRANELFSYAYRHLYGLPQTGLRFFTVYGPWGRPDMAYYSFARAIVAGEPITVYDNGDVRRDFTYIDDIVGGVIRCLALPPAAGEPPRILNIGNHRSERVGTLVALLEQGLGRPAVIRYQPRPAADVAETFACVDRIAALTGFTPSTPLADGVARFVAWFQKFHGTEERA
jgi:UDP-glucuronate 4-epimerase